MGSGGAFYLGLVIVSFCLFAVVLAYYSEKQTRSDRARAATGAAERPLPSANAATGHA